MTMIKEILSPAELERLKIAAGDRRDAFLAKRDTAWLTLNYVCTLRISESLDLKPTDYSPEDRVILVRRGKGNKARKVAIGEKGRAVLDQWLKDRAEAGLSDDAPIFCTKNGTRLERTTLNKQLNKWKRKARILKRVHPHQLRYSGASQMLRKGANISHIQGQLGHSTPLITMHYLLDVDPQQRAQDQEKWEP